MGYQEIEIPTGFSLLCVTFKNVSGGSFDIQDMQIYKDGVKYEQSIARLQIQKMLLDGDNEGYYDDEQVYNWKKRSGRTGWWKGNTTYCEGDYKVTLDAGEGLSVNNTSGGTLTLRVSGEVELTPWSMEIPTGFSLIGNMTPVTLDLQDAKVYMADKTTLYEQSIARVQVQKMLIDGDNEGYYDDEQVYNWKKRSGRTGWWKGNTTYCEGDNAVSLAPGEAVSINNTSGNPLYIKFKDPVTK